MKVHLTSGQITVLLVVPNYSERISNVAQTTVGPPLGLAYLAGGLLQQGIEVSILDANALGLSEGLTVEAMVESGAGVVGFSAVTPTIDQCGRLAGLLRARLPDCLLVVGGMHPTAAPEDTLERYPAFDLVVRGEADTRFAEILEALAADQDPDQLAGISFRDPGDGKVISTPLPPLTDLDALPLPARHLLPMERYIGPDGDRFTTIVATRGCPGRCIYCSVNQSFGRRLRHHDPQRVAQEMALCRERFDTRVFAFVDDTFTSDRQWVLRLCDALRTSGLHGSVRWFCLTRVDRVDPELLAAMREAGCFKLELGIESGDQRILDYLGKGTRTGQIVEAFKWARRAGMKTFGFVMLFSPLETAESLRATRRLIFEADPDLLQVSFCTPYPGTRLADLFAKEGIPFQQDWSRYVFLKAPVMEHPRFSRQQMLDTQQNLLRSFYLRPRTALRLALGSLADGTWRGFARTARAALFSLLKGAR